MSVEIEAIVVTVILLGIWGWIAYTIHSDDD